MRSARWILLAALAAAACHRGGAPPVDLDRDGVVASADCDDTDPKVWAAMTAYRDADGDGVGGAAAWFCTNGTVPPGFVLQGGDCAPDDPLAWRSIPTPAADRDGDGYTVTEQTPLCVGATLPAPYLEAANGNDCDDGDPALFRWVVLYRDQDGDGVGARPRTISCVGASLPAGFSLAGYDADDLDPAIASGPTDDVVLDLVLD